MELLAQYGDDGGGGGGAALGGLFLLLLYLAVLVAMIAGMWKTFEKAGEPGWAAIVPLYNAWVLVRISGKEPLWFVLLFIPCLNILAAIVVSVAVAERFVKTAAFGFGLALLPFVFYPMLGFGDDEYQGTAGQPL
jgi:hypothetical protein